MANALELRHTLSRRFNYYRRIFAAYVTRGPSQLTFWHDRPEVNEKLRDDAIGPYYMPFSAKADYPGPFDAHGIPLLDYRGAIGPQYNPIAIAQYGLGNYNLFLDTTSATRRDRFMRAADWHVTALEQNAAGLWVWNHHFEWDYRTTLVAPWYSGLAQGQGISLLVRAHRVTGDRAYLDAAGKAFEPFMHTTGEGGVTCVDDDGDVWIEEYIVEPPTHVLNGFMWAAWGVYDFFLQTRDGRAQQLFNDSVATLSGNLSRYDTGFWSLYEQSGTRLKMIASSFYHDLHIAQLEVMARLTGKDEFRAYAERWRGYRASPARRYRAALHKAVFKVLYY